VTLNIKTSLGDEGIVIRYWTDIMSDSQANELGDLLAQVMEIFIDNPHQLVEELDLSDIHRSGESTRAENTQSHTSHGDMRTVVADCVREVLEQLFRSGALVSYSPQIIRDAGINVSPQVIQPMIDYSQIRNPLLMEEIEKTEYKIGTSPVTRSQQGIVEEKLLSVWSRLLRIPEDAIESEANFFELGGDSIVAMQMAGMARDEDLSLTVANIFRHPVFAEMAAAIQFAEASSRTQELNPQTNHRDANEARSHAIQNALYQRYSLLEAANVDAFLQEYICPKVRAFRGGIVDVFPVTDFQALAVMGSLMESKWMLNYFYLEGEGSLDIQHLKSAISRIVDAFDILRTVFVPYSSRFFQVVLRKLQPVFAVHDTDDLAEFTSALQKKDREFPTRLGESFLQFTVAKERSNNRHRIIIRISHAQYDGVCFPRILAALQAGYRGREIPLTPAFSGYVRDAARMTTDDHYMYWNNLLKGSLMTEVIQRQEPNYSRGTEAPVTLKRIIQAPSLASEAITPANIIKAAWSLVLGQVSASSDIIFGNVISGRNTSVLGVESIVGPCVNMIPVRVTFQPNWSALDLLKHIQDQQVANMPYESLGFREIVKHCTSWPDWTNFSTVCQHQNIQRQSRMKLGGNEYTLGAVGSQEDFADITILSTPQDDDNIEICLIFTIHSGITISFAESLFESLCDTIVSFSTDPAAALPAPNELEAMEKQTLKQSPLKANDEIDANLKHLSKEDLARYSSILREAWIEIRLTSSFYQLNGDIIGLAQLASVLERQGFKLRVEDLVDHPVFAQQLALLVVEGRKNREREEDDRRYAKGPERDESVEKTGKLKKIFGKDVKKLITKVKKVWN
jgi:aryl carrier-like protein